MTTETGETSETTASSPSTPHPQRNTKKTPHGPISELKLSYVNEDHVAAFVKALAHDPLHSENEPEHISASSDLMLMRQVPHKRSKRLAREQEAITPKGVSQSLLRYPFIIGIGITIFIELLLYIGLRQIKVIQHLRMYRESSDPEDAVNLKDVLYACLKQNFAGIENAKLYSNTYLGTKVLVEEYVEEVTRSINALAKNTYLSFEEKRLAFKLYSRNYGKTAFCLSGGAGFGYYHFGVIRALLDRNLLPPIITGTSAGSLLGAIVCTRTDEELREILTPALAEKINIVSGGFLEHISHYMRTGALYDSESWCREAMWYTRGSTTFKEAYERTGRIYNVSVVPSDAHSPPKLLNYITAPDCVIWSAVLASAAIPGILNPVVLMQKAKNGQLIPYNYGHRFKDGSLRTDIPTQTLYNYFNVNYTVVSQVNPHIHLFFYAPQGSPGRPVTHLNGKGWRGGFIASTAEQLLKLDLSKWLKVLRDLDLLPKLLNQDWSSIWLQKFDGNVTILPKSKLSDWLYILSDPNEERLKILSLAGKLRTWPKVAMISNRLRIESAIELNHSMTTSDDASGSEDEQRFLKSRRTSIASNRGKHETEEGAIKEEESRRRRFLAQFSDRREVLDGHEIVAEAQASPMDEEVTLF
ncbi:acyl transferase/acyl hydrolase/lysophospholipase [Spinellus fusiger]|nr:acyl transferase/acyl hydrolase/lysophospholipase [Spinellus fusiger]